MVTIILPGYLIHNKEWLEDTAEKINVDGEIRPIYWGHWDDPTIKFSAEEKGRLIDGIAGTRVTNIIAKSIGTLAASYMIRRCPEKINKVVFCGVPLNDLNESDKEIIKGALKLLPVKNLICFQNEEDPHGEFEQVRVFLSDVDSNIEVIKKNRDDHEYFYVDEFRNFILR